MIILSDTEEYSSEDDLNDEYDYIPIVYKIAEEYSSKLHLLKLETKLYLHCFIRYLNILLI